MVPLVSPYDPGGNGNYLPGMGGGEGGYGGYGGGDGSNSIFGATISDSAIYQALSFANSSMGLALSQAEASAVALKVKLPPGITVLGGSLTALATIDNGIQWLEGGDWQDGAQAALGAASTIAAFVPGGQGVAFVLGSILFVWELAE